MEYQKMLIGDNPYFVACVYYSYPLHYHSETEVLFCVKGSAKVIVENTEYQMTEDSIIMINALELHQIIAEKDTIILVLEFGSQLLGPKYKEFISRRFTKRLISPEDECSYKSRFVKPLKRLYKEHTTRKNGFEWVIQGLLLEVFGMMARYVPMEKQDFENRKNLEQYLKIQKAFDLIHEEYSDEISLDRVASHIGYDKRAFCRIFKNVTNMTFHEYLNFYRISVAVQYLKFKSHSIGEIGQMVGIPVAKSFSRIFRQYMGMSPKEYRNATDTDNKHIND